MSHFENSPTKFFYQNKSIIIIIIIIIIISVFSGDERMGWYKGFFTNKGWVGDIKVGIGETMG